MICHNCGERLEEAITDLPFKIDRNSIIIIKQLPILQCQNCNEYLIEDPVMEKVDSILAKVDKTTELEFIKFTA